MHATKPHQDHVLIAGGGIGGLVTALTLHQIGVPCTVYESVRNLKPMGVGINLQPNAVRELFDLGVTAEQLDAIGVPAREWALVGQNGKDIYSEARGLDAGYHWPQYAVHRGAFHMMLYQLVCERLGPNAVQLGQRVTGYSLLPDGGVAAHIEYLDATASNATSVAHDGTERPDASEVHGTLLIGADGIHSNVRATMHPNQPPIHWGGALMWRGTTRMKPIRTGSSFVGLGTHRQRMVIYPISHPDAQGEALVNWIAEVTIDDPDAHKRSGWFQQVEIDSFAHHFDGWRYDWLDVPALIRGASAAYENPMIDRDPVSTWQDGPVALLGDAAHAMYPTGSNGASQAIIDARTLGASMLTHGVTPNALHSYDQTLCEPISALILRNRGAGPFGMLDIVDERCQGEFDDIETVFPHEERQSYMAGYKQAAGFAIETLNNSAPTIPPGARVALS